MTTVTTLPDTLTIRDDAGDLTITYPDMLKYHGRDFYGGVALAFKVLKLAFEKLLGPEVPHRNAVRIVLGFDPPGVVDALEYATRALTRKRLIMDPDPGEGPDSVFGRYYFEVHYGRNSIALWLKPGILPEEFTGLARKSIAGLATPEEVRKWTGYKQILGTRIMDTPPEDLLDFRMPAGS